MQEMDTDRASADSAKNGQIAKNVGLGVAGAFLIVRLAFMDTSDAHSVEAKANQARYKRLQAIYQDRGWVTPGAATTTATAQPPIEQVPVQPIQIVPTTPNGT